VNHPLSLLPTKSEFRLWCSVRCIFLVLHAILIKFLLIILDQIVLFLHCVVTEVSAWRFLDTYLARDNCPKNAEYYTVWLLKFLCEIFMNFCIPNISEFTIIQIHCLWICIV
jgi:hypothetical protein